ncbi:MAG TPA: cysteine--tRNA ligase [Candidatus Hydrogenedentes bacterium]|nr:cysteine--tRNA ligase [Candidatus Hydrogenedentota bacterium]HPG65698.1 cysteine--tRNA ligase [Candidatus Hydrogenedentota bacterium]
MAIRFFNTLSRKKEVFEPVNPPVVGLYTCGPTVYNYAHIGNFRAYVAQDLLKRFLTYRGYRVTHVMNLTDVEDKIIRTCRETGESRAALTGRYIEAFFKDLDTLRIVRADHCPAATDCVPEMVDLIQRLRDKGHTYEVDGSTYFRLSSFPTYGRLSHFDMDQLQSGASGRVDTDEYDLENARDFVLWKAYDNEDGDIFWDTAIGKGRPGWHIECSVMSMKFLGETFDIHCGGEDLIFPHHENEIAQSECATGKPFVKYWLHNAYLLVENRKMSKSLGNFFTLRDLLEKGMDPLAIRWVLLATHYRMPNNFSFEAVEAASQSLRRINDFRTRLGEVAGAGGDAVELVESCEKAFGDALDDDLNISGALGAVFDFIRDVNKLMDNNALGESGARNVVALLDRLDAVTGVFAGAAGASVPQDVLERVRDRQEARRHRDFAQADAIRNQLAEAGWIIEDTADGPRVKRK